MYDQHPKLQTQVMSHPPTSYTPRLLVVAALIISLLTFVGQSQAQDALPSADPDFSAPHTVGPGSRYFVEDPHLVTEADGSLSAAWSWGVRDHLFYSHSTDNGNTWTAPIDIGGNTLWGGSEGNISLVADKYGRLHLSHYQLYGENYPHVEYRLRDEQGHWHQPVWLPNSADLRMKINALGVDPTGRAYVLAGRSGDSLYLYSANSEGSDFSTQGNLPLVPNSHPNPVWLPALGFNNDGGMITAWGDARQDGLYRLATAWYSDTWHTHLFDEASPTGWQNGWQQYRVRMTTLPDGGIAAVFEGRDEDDAKDIYYREWNPAKYGVRYSGWATDTVRFATPPLASEAPAICLDPSGQRYVFWQDSYSNLRIVYTHSADGRTWHPLQFVNSGPHVREKHPTCSVAGGKLHVMWVDKLEGGQARLYYAARELPALYPAPPPTATLTLTP